MGILAGNHNLIAPGSDSSMLVTGCEDGSVRVWMKDSLGSGKLTAITDFSAGCPCHALAFHTADILVGAYADGYLRIFHLGEVKKVIAKVPVCDEALHCIDYGHNGIIAGSEEGGVYVISLVSSMGADASKAISSATVVKAASGPEDGRGVTCVQARSKTRHFLSAFDNGEIWVWKEHDVASLAPVHEDVGRGDIGEIICTWTIRSSSETSARYASRQPPITGAFLEGNRICGSAGTTIGIYDFERQLVLQSVSVDCLGSYVTQMVRRKVCQETFKVN